MNLLYAFVVGAIAVKAPTFKTPEAPTTMPCGETKIAWPPMPPSLMVFKRPFIIIWVSTRFTNLSSEMFPFLRAKIRFATSPWLRLKLL